MTLLLFAVLPVALTFGFVVSGWHKSTLLYDFRGNLYQPGHEIARGHNPYDAAFLSHQAALKRAGEPVKTVIVVPSYPAPTLVSAVPLSLLPYRVAGVLYVLLSVSALILGLRLVGVNDWRCYGVPFLSWPVLHGLMLGALTPLLVLGVAAAWRWRDQLWPSAAALAALVTAKLFLWPVGVWFILTRRYRTTALACIVAAAALLIGWAVIGFAGLADYPGILSDLSFIEEGVGVSVVAGLLAVGASSSIAKIGALALAASLIVGARFATHRRSEHRTFAVALVAALVASPIVWPHYLALLFVPIALVSPRLAPIWFAPLLAYLAPVAQTNHRPWEILPYYLISAAVVYVALRRTGSSAALRADGPVESSASALAAQAS
jgi:hypothetical protein